MRGSLDAGAPHRTPSPRPAREMMLTMRVEKRKWDGTVSAVDIGHPVEGVERLTSWLVTRGTERQRPSADRVEVVSSDEIWAATPGEWWVLCGYVADGTVEGYKVHAAAPFDPPGSDGDIVWVDLDLDFEVHGDEVGLEDEAQFHEHARSMGYPDAVV